MKYLLLALLLTACENENMLIPQGQKYTAGEQVIINGGFYQNCKATMASTKAYWAFKAWCKDKTIPCVPKYKVKNVICKGVLVTDELDVYEDNATDLGVSNRKSL